MLPGVTLRQIVRTLAERDGVDAVLLTSRDGLPIEQAGRRALEGDAVAALAATLARQAGQVGEAAGVGEFATGVLEHEDGACIIGQLGADAWLVVLAQAEADLGELLYLLRQHRMALAALL